MHRIVISGYYGFGNGGDEAMLTSLVAGLRRHHPTARLTVLSADPMATTAEYGVAAVGRLSPGGILGALRGADLLISGGGNLLQDVSGPFNIPYYLGLVEVARWHGVATMLLGQGIGPVAGQWGRWLIRHLADRVDAITVRDQQSAIFLRGLGVTRPQITLAADTVFSLDPKAMVTDEPPSAVIVPSDGALVAVSLRQRGLPDPARAMLATALSVFTTLTGTKLLLVPMQPNEDLPMAEWMVNRLGSDRAAVSPARHWRHILAEFKRCEAVVAMRLHALIFAALADRAPLGLSYDPKVDLFLAQVGLKPVAAADRLPPADLLAQQLVAAFSQRRQMVDQINRALPELRRKADLNFLTAVSLVDNYKNVTGPDTLRQEGRNG